MSTLSERRYLGSARPRFLAETSAEEDRRKAQTAINAHVWSYQLWLDAGADKLDILDQVRGDLDIASNIDGRILAELDEVGAHDGISLDVSGLEALAERLEAETTIQVRLISSNAAAERLADAAARGVESTED